MERQRLRDNHLSLFPKLFNLSLGIGPNNRGSSKHQCTCLNLISNQGSPCFYVSMTTTRSWMAYIHRVMVHTQVWSQVFLISTYLFSAGQLRPYALKRDILFYVVHVEIGPPNIHSHPSTLQRVHFCTARDGSQEVLYTKHFLNYVDYQQGCLTQI